MLTGTTRVLYLLRHAKSSWDDPELADHDRPLSGRGRRNAAVLADQLRREGISPELVLCSSARRTTETVEAAGVEGAISVEDGLYGASATELLERLRAVPDEISSVMLVGHNPGLEDLAAELAGPDAPERLPTAALVTLELEGGWCELDEAHCRLVGTVVPR
jgi:phosphohistidine phosphatase